jgi:hypothetical protein
VSSLPANLFPAWSFEEIPSIVRTINVVPAGIVAALAHEIVINSQTSAGAKGIISCLIDLFGGQRCHYVFRNASLKDLEVEHCLSMICLSIGP